MRASAFDHHLLALGQQVINLLQARGISHADAEDAVSAAFEKVYVLLPTLTVTNLDGWFYRVALNSYLDHYRKHQRLAFTAPPETGVENATPFATLIAELSPSDQEVLALKYYYGFTYREIATMLAAKPTSIQKQLARARTKLRQNWEE